MLTELELWDSNFHPISLHGSIKHIASDTKNIKDTLNFMTRYISNKQVDSSKSNDLEDFNSIGEVIWNFISSVYQANWDSIYADKQFNLLRRKIVAKFTLKIQPTYSKNIKNNIISKYFKSNKLANNTKQPPKLYAQASK